MVRMSASRVSSQGVGVAWFLGIFCCEYRKEVEGDGEKRIETRVCCVLVGRDVAMGEE